MGTRSTTTIYEDREPLMTFYRQYDGYPSGHGQALVDFLKTIKMVNGIPMGQDEPMQMANGVGCLVAQMIVHFKTGVTNHNYSPDGPVVREGDHVGGIYVVPLDERSGAYHYDVFVDDNNIKIAVDGQEYNLNAYDGLQIEHDEEMGYNE